MEVKIKRLYENVKLPSLATVGSGCYDIHAFLVDAPKGQLKLEPGIVRLVGTGLAFEIPPGYLLEVRPRSSLSMKGVIIVNSPGTLDSDYRGELRVLLCNFSPDMVYVEHGDRIAQIRLVPLIFTSLREVEDLSSTERGTEGFGSTGR